MKSTIINKIYSDGQDSTKRLINHIETIDTDTNSTIEKDTKTPLETNHDRSNNLMSECTQTESIHTFYEEYLHAISHLNAMDLELVKRNFDNYINSVEIGYLENIDKNFCDNYRPPEFCKKGSARIERHADHSEDYIESLTEEFYALFKVLDMIWKNEAVRTKDILFLTPCRIFLLNSILKRKYEEALDIEYINKVDLEYKSACEYSAVHEDCQKRRGGI